MLVLSRDCDTVIRIGPDIRVKVLSIRKRRVKLGVDAPSNVRVWREEIEDDPSHAGLIARALADAHFPEVVLAPTGTAAIKALGGDGVVGENIRYPHLVLLDLHLPDIPGVEVLRRIRASDRLHTLPVVVLTAAREDAIVADCLEAGANAFVNKSVEFAEFRESVSRIANFWKNDCRLPRAVAR